MRQPPSHSWNFNLDILLCVFVLVVVARLAVLLQSELCSDPNYQILDLFLWQGTCQFSAVNRDFIMLYAGNSTDI